MPAPGPGQAFGAPPPGAPGPAAAPPGYPFNASPSPGPGGFAAGGPSGQAAPAAPGYPYAPESTGLADAPPIADAPRFQRGPFDAGPAPYFEDVGGHEPERLLVRSGPSPAVLAIGGTLLAGVAAAAFVFGGDLLHQLEPPEVDPVEDTAEDVEASEAAPEPAPSLEPTEAPEPAAESDAAGEEPPAETAAAAPEEAGDSGESGEATNDSAEASADPTPAAPSTKKRDSGSGSSGTTPKKKKKKTTTKKSAPKVKKKRKKTKREKRADQAAERDPGRVIYELQMLSAAKKALNSKPLQALAYAEQHASEFPRSQFVAQRREIMIKALCKLGRKDKAQREASKSAKAQRVFDSNCR